MMSLSPLERDALTEVVNIGVGKAAESLNEILRRHIRLSVPRIRIMDAGDFDIEELQRLEGLGGTSNPVCVVQGFSGDHSGKVALVFPQGSAAYLVSALTGEALSSPELDMVRVGTLVEIGNIVINAMVGSMSNLLHANVSFHLPEFNDYGLATVIGAGAGAAHSQIIIVAETRFHIEDLDIGGYLLLLFEVEGVQAILAGVTGRQAGR